MTQKRPQLIGLNHSKMPRKIKNTSWIPDNEAKLLIKWALRYVQDAAKGSCINNFRLKRGISTISTSALSLPNAA